MRHNHRHTCHKSKHTSWPNNHTQAHRDDKSATTDLQVGSHFAARNAFPVKRAALIWQREQRTVFGPPFPVSKVWQPHLTSALPPGPFPQQAPAFVSQVNFHGATSKPGRRGNQTCLCSYCRTPASRQLDILCRSCGRVLQPRYDSYKPTGYSYFDLLELKPDFNVDLMVLDARYKALQKELHPDKNLEADEKQRAWNDEHRKQVALAVAILRCPARRVLHLLQHHFPCLPTAPSELFQAGTDKGGAEEEKVERVTDANLLAEVLELNEALERVRTRDELSFFEKRIREILQIDEKELATTYREKDVEGMKVNAQRYMMHAAFLDRIKNWAPDGA